MNPGFFKRILKRKRPVGTPGPRRNYIMYNPEGERKIVAGADIPELTKQGWTAKRKK